MERKFARYATLFYAHLCVRRLGRWCWSIFPRCDTPCPGAIANLEPQPLQFPLRVHVYGCSHGLFVSRANTGRARVCEVAPYACLECQCLEIWPLGMAEWVHVARFLPFSSGSPNQYFNNPPLLVASMWDFWSSAPRCVRSVVGGTWDLKTTM